MARIVKSGQTEAGISRIQLMQLSNMFIKRFLIKYHFVILAFSFSLVLCQSCKKFAGSELDGSNLVSQDNSKVSEAFFDGEKFYVCLDGKIVESFSEDEISNKYHSAIQRIDADLAAEIEALNKRISFSKKRKLPNEEINRVNSAKVHFETKREEVAEFKNRFELLLGRFFASSCLTPPLDTEKEYSVYTSKKSYNLVRLLIEPDRGKPSKITPVPTKLTKKVEGQTLEEISRLPEYKAISNISYLYTSTNLEFKIDVNEPIFLTKVYKDVGDDLKEENVVIFKDGVSLELTFDNLKSIKGFPVCGLKFGLDRNPESRYEFIPKIRDRYLNWWIKQNDLVAFRFSLKTMEDLVLFCGCLDYERKGFRSQSIKNVVAEKCKKRLHLEDIFQNLPPDIIIKAYSK